MFKNFYYGEQDEELIDKVREIDKSDSEVIRDALEVYFGVGDLRLDENLEEGIREHAKEKEQNPREILNEWIADIFDYRLVQRVNGKEMRPLKKYADKFNQGRDEK